MSLREYHRKRDFKKTAEPSGKTPSAEKAATSAPRFVVQKHAASRLHYDFRLEMEGVLKSWAVPKGFPIEKGERRLAVQVEDHPLDYAEFEGIIPQGEYGGGTVMVWDIGTYRVGGDNPPKALQEGKLHLFLTGQKLQDEWTLVQSHHRGDDRNWFLIKTGDPIKPFTKKQEDHSVLTARTLPQIADQKTATWHSNRPSHERPSPGAVGPRRRTLKSGEAAKPTRQPPTSKTRPSTKETLPAPQWLEPMKATLVSEPPPTGDWLYELKWDGYRALALKHGSEVQLISRNQKALGPDFPELLTALAQLPVHTAILDGEICALDQEGRPAFQLLQSREMGRQRPPLFYYAFDLLQLESQSLLELPLLQRKAALQQLLADAPPEVRYSAPIQGEVQKLLAEVRARGMEGLIGKLQDSTYQPGVRTKAWVKLKVHAEQEFVIGGHTPPAGSRKHLGALLVGYYEKKQLRFAGKVGTGFNAALLKLLSEKIGTLQTKECPFIDLPQKASGRWSQAITAAEMRRCTWCQPILVAQIKFTEWTSDGSLRHPVFLGLRQDKSAIQVHREIAA